MENKRQKIELSDIFRQYAEEYKQSVVLCSEQEKAYNAIMQCRTASLGGHVEHCDHCSHTRYAYNSCRNRHCPKCQFVRKSQWVDQLAGTLPAVKHFHVVFTIPQTLNSLFYLNQDKAYSLLFKAAGKALMQLTANPQFMGAQAGAVAILHTWGQNLSYHPHIHAIVPAGGLSDDHMEWIPSGKKFLVPVKILSRVFRGILCYLLRDAVFNEEILLPDEIGSFDEIKARCYKKDWVVYCEKSFANTNSLIHYLGNYTHRVAISNNRIIAHTNGSVVFSVKDYKAAGIRKILSLDAHEFIRRFLQHVLPSGFYKIRYWGFMAMCNMKSKLKQCYDLIQKATYLPLLQGLSALEVWREITGLDPLLCPKCKTGRMLAVKVISSNCIEHG